VVWKSMSSECTEERRRFLEDKDKAKLVRERMMNYTNPGAARRSSLPVNDAAAAAPKGKKGRRGSLLGPCLTKQLIEYDALVEYVTQTIIERIGETVPAPRQILAVADSAQFFEEWRQGVPAPADLSFLVQVTTTDNVTMNRLSHSKPWEILKNADGTLMNGAKRRWRKAGAILRTRIVLNQANFGGKPVEPQGAAGGSPKVEKGKPEDVLGGWFRQITFKRVNPSGVKSFTDIFVL